MPRRFGSAGLGEIPVMVVVHERDLREIAKEVPLDRLLVETDCPFLAPVPHRGKRNEPAYVVEVAKCIAEVKGTELEVIARQTSDNFKQLFDPFAPASAR